ncbi:MAG TPA: HD domain-containing phosphohydrolase [Burkholderiaceae bacterium]
MHVDAPVRSPDAALPLAEAQERPRFRLDVARLQRGMFVAELDRPWFDTPFLIRGFLVDNDIELRTMQRYCRYVYIDLHRSTPQAAKLIRASAIADAGAFSDLALHSTPMGPEPQPAGVREDGARGAGGAPDPAGQAHAGIDPEGADIDPADEAGAGIDPEGADIDPATPLWPRAAGRAYRVRADVRVSGATRKRFRSFVRGMPSPADSGGGEESLARRALERLRGLLAGSAGDQPGRGGAASRSSRAEPLPEVEAALAPGARLVAYADRREAAAELPRARAAFSRSDEALSALVEDIRGGRVPDLAQVGDAVSAMVGSVVDNPDALLWLAQLHEENRRVSQHGVRVAVYLMTLGRQLGLPRATLSQLGTIGMLADVGKTRLPQALLDKPGMLNPAEYGIVKEHVQLGLEALSQQGRLAPEVALGIAQHHERLDGSGYPRGLKGDEIGLYGKMAAIADCFTALSARRAYADPLAPQDALMSLYQWADTSFHGALVEQFVRAIGVFPVGSLVELSTGAVAVVVANQRVRRLQPRVLLLTGPDKRQLAAPLEVDLLQRPREEQSESLRIVRALPAGAYGLVLRDYYGDGSVAAA